MSSWRTKADVLKSLSEVNGRRTGIEDLDRHVVAGEQPPPIHNEIPDEDEMSYFFSGHGVSANEGAGPDLAGISTMLKMVSDFDDTRDNNEPMTLFRNTTTDEIRISKLNPNAGVYVPGGGLNYNRNIPKNSPKKNNKVHGSNNKRKTGNENIASSYSNFKSKSIKDSQEKNNSTTCEAKNESPTFNSINMFKRKSVKDSQEDKINPTCEAKNESPTFNSINMFKRKSVKDSQEDKINPTCEAKNESPTFNSINMFKRKSVKDSQEDKINSTTCEAKNESPTFNSDMFNSNCVPERNETANANNINTVQTESETRFLINGLPKRQIEKPKAEELKHLQDKVKSTIVASSVDSSLQTKRLKNVAIATLLKLGVAPAEKQVKLIKPDYFEKAPTGEVKKESELKEEVKKEDGEVNEFPSTSSSQTNVNYIDEDSISKVNGWFTSMECPKPKPQLQEPLVLKDCITFKKKAANTSVTSRNTSSTTEPARDRETKCFKPSNYASELLRKYETNAQQHGTLNEDLGTSLERQLRERDEVIRQKMLARQNAG